MINENLKNVRGDESNAELSPSKRIRLDEDDDTEKDFNWMPIPILDPIKDIERVHCPSIEQFLTCYIQAKKPVILVGCMDHWPAMQKWSFDYLIQLAGDRTVPIELGSRYSDDDWTQKLMTIADFVNQYCKQRSSRRGYLAQHPLLDQIPDLKKDICIPDYCYISSDENEDEDIDLNAWIGPKQTISPLHNDPKQNLLAQVVGEKYIRLYDPIYSSQLYALGSTMLNNTSSIDVENPDYERFPLFKDVPYLEFILKPDMTEENLPKDENNTSDDEIRPDLANTNSTGENSSDDNLNDDEELDFYDFIEVVSDKFDDITTQIEERREDSRKRLRRTIDELEAQKRLLKAQLQQRINVWSENIKQPNFIRTRDKISFSIGVANACFSPLIAGRWPHILPLVYTYQALFLITLRFFIYKRKSWHYFVYDLCYFVNLLTLLYLWIFPSSKILFTVCYTLSHGPLGFAIVLWRNSLVFHSLDKVTSLFIHMYPPLTLFTLRWLLPIELQRERYPAIVHIGETLHTKTAVFYTIIFYLIWQLLYYAFIIYGRRDKVARGLRATSYTWLLSDKNGFVSRLIQKFGFGETNDGINRYKIVFYFFLQFAYMLLSILPVCFWYYRNMYVNVIFLCSIFAVSVYNGASFYIDVFSHRYIKSLELLRDCDENEGTDGTQRKSAQISSNTIDAEQKKQS
ncbi:unnamed protein product [Adineta ricciae]|nr:unnamed protein product [Adineta ricciae]